MVSGDCQGASRELDESLEKWAAPISWWYLFWLCIYTEFILNYSQILIIPVTPLLYTADNFNTSDNKAFKSHYAESLANMLDPFVTVFWHRTGCVFVILNCLSPDSVSCFHHIVLERCQTSGFPKLTSCWRLCDCGASSFMWQQHPPPRPKCVHMHGLTHAYKHAHRYWRMLCEAAEERG